MEIFERYEHRGRNGRSDHGLVYRSCGWRSRRRAPEKRAKAAYLAFEEANLPLIREELPVSSIATEQTLREVEKAPDNPMNQV